ncbi:MAG: thioesterase [Bacteroidetes bacterium]|nr:MAG: thioesterase [Bacteroidota bacterium]TAE70915.1 MAG: thioesterase [Bacteroidota bacterium]TAF94059.1 MAG: thioesterase [Bacteroidota bacterium]
MNRLKLTLPQQWQWHQTVQIPIYFINYGGHMGNDAFLQLLHQARIDFFKSKGFTELDIDGTASIMADSQLCYKAELKEGDTVKISVACTDFDRLGFDMYYCVQKQTPTGWVTALEAKTGIMGFDYKVGKKKSFSEVAVQQLQLLQP